MSNTEAAEADRASVATDLVDLRDLPLSRIGSLADAGLLKRVLPEPSAKRVAVAAFQSSI